MNVDLSWYWFVIWTAVIALVWWVESVDRMR
jgi:hypothetical protein